MSKIRINDLARELEIKSKAVLDYLQEIDVPDKRSHSSALDDDLAERVRQHFQSTTLEGPRESAPPVSPPLVSKPEVPAAPSTPAAPSHAPAAVKKTFEFHIEPRPMTRTLDEIRESARKAVAPPPPPPAAVRPVERHPEKPAIAAAGPTAAPGAMTQRLGQAIPPASRVPSRIAPQAPAISPSAQEVRPAKPGAEAAVKAGPVAETAAPARAPEFTPAISPGRQVRPAKHAKSPSSSQPIYPGVISPKGAIPSRPPGPRGTHEPRPQHPTASRPVPAAGGVHAAGAPAARQPSHRPAPPFARHQQRPHPVA